MTDTIELLDTIGSDASLRYAARDALAAALARRQASAGLLTAVAAGSSEPLREALDLRQLAQVLNTHAPGHGDDDDGEGECDPPKPERRRPDEPSPNPPVRKAR